MVLTSWPPHQSGCWPASAGALASTPVGVLAGQCRRTGLHTSRGAGRPVQAPAQPQQSGCWPASAGALASTPVGVLAGQCRRRRNHSSRGAGRPVQAPAQPQRHVDQPHQHLRLSPTERVRNPGQQWDAEEHQHAQHDGADGEPGADLIQAEPAGQHLQVEPAQQAEGEDLEHRVDRH